MKVSKQSLVLVMGGALAVGASVAPAKAADNPFALKLLSAGYMVANNAGDKTQEGKCGAGKCGSSMEEKPEKSKDAACPMHKKAKEGSCGGEKAKEGSCGGEKAKEGSCGGEKH